MRFKLIFVWYDLWIGFFWDREAHWLYFFPLPMLGIVFKFHPKNRFPNNRTHQTYRMAWWHHYTALNNKERDLIKYAERQKRINKRYKLSE